MVLIGLYVTKEKDLIFSSMMSFPEIYVAVLTFRKPNNE